MPQTICPEYFFELTYRATLATYSLRTGGRGSGIFTHGKSPTLGDFASGMAANIERLEQLSGIDASSK